MQLYMSRQAEKHLQVRRKVSCRYIDSQKSICNNEYQSLVDTLIPKRVSATENIKGLQIHQLPKEHLHKQINREYRYIRYQKSKSTHRSTYFNHDTPQSKKKTMQSSELESGLPDEAEQECIVFSCLEAVDELNSNLQHIKILHNHQRQIHIHIIIPLCQVTSNQFLNLSHPVQ